MDVHAVLLHFPSGHTWLIYVLSKLNQPHSTYSISNQRWKYVCALWVVGIACCWAHSKIQGVLGPSSTKKQGRLPQKNFVCLQCGTSKTFLKYVTSSVTSCTRHLPWRRVDVVHCIQNKNKGFWSHRVNDHPVFCYPLGWQPRIIWEVVVELSQNYWCKIHRFLFWTILNLLLCL